MNLKWTHISYYIAAWVITIFCAISTYAERQPAKRPITAFDDIRCHDIVATNMVAALKAISVYKRATISSVEEVSFVNLTSPNGKTDVKIYAADYGAGIDVNTEQGKVSISFEELAKIIQERRKKESER